MDLTFSQVISVAVVDVTVAAEFLFLSFACDMAIHVFVSICFVEVGCFFVGLPRGEWLRIRKRGVVDYCRLFMKSWFCFCITALLDAGKQQ